MKVRYGSVDMFGRKPKEEPARLSREPRQSAPVFSYYSSRNRAGVNVGREHLDTPKMQRNTRRLMYQLPVILTMSVIAACLIYLSTLTTVPKIVPYVDSTPNLLQSSDVYAAAAAEILGSSLMNRSKLTIDTDGVAHELQRRFPELNAVTVIMPLAGRRPIIELQPVTPVVTLASESGIFVLNAEGRAVMESRNAPAEIIKNIPLLVDETAMPVELGELALTHGMVLYVTNLASQMKAADVRIESLTLPPVPHELHLRAAGEGYYVKFHTLGDARLQSGAYLAVREKLARSAQAPAEYIDVRLEDKVFYR